MMLVKMSIGKMQKLKFIIANCLLNHIRHIAALNIVVTRTTNGLGF